MKLILLAFRNVLRQRMRSAATLAAIAVGVTGLILAGGFVEDIFVKLGEAIIHAQTGHIQVTRSGYRDVRAGSSDKYLIADSERLKARLKEMPGVDRAYARLAFSGVANNGRRDVGIVGEGIEPEAEGGGGTYLRYIEGRPLTGKDVDGIVVGQGVARLLGLQVGDRLNLVVSLAEGAVNTLDFELVGVFQTFSKEFDARAVRIPIAAARSLMDTEGAHIVVVMLQQTRDTEHAAHGLRTGLGPDGFDVADWKSLSDFYDKTVKLYDRQFGVLRLIILLMVLLSVANTVNMTIFERTREFGTVLALGMRQSVVFRSVIAEGVIVGFLGAVLGMAMGCAAAWLISAIGIPMPPPPNANLGYTATIQLSAAGVMTAGLIGFVAAVLASIRPARRVAQQDIVEALRHGV